MRALAGAIAGVAASPCASGAFTIDDGFHVCAIGTCGGTAQALDVAQTIAAAPRWSASPIGVSGAGLHDGVQVAIAPGFAAGLAPDPSRIAEMEQAVTAAFAAWETPSLRFDLHWDAPVVRGTATGFEIDLYLSDSRDPAFQGTTFVGYTIVDAVFDASRTLTNGQVLPGYAIDGADVVVASDRFEGFFALLLASDTVTEEDRAARLQNLVMHEIGHAIGLDHMNEFPYANLDTDGDPMTRIAVDPADPFAGLAVSAVIDPNAIMRGGLPPDLSALLFTGLRPDDASGRDVLYPGAVPEPGTAVLVGVGLALLGRRAGRPTRR